jgi:hypothetical protein
MTSVQHAKHPSYTPRRPLAAISAAVRSTSSAEVADTAACVLAPGMSKPRPGPALGDGGAVMGPAPQRRCEVAPPQPSSARARSALLLRASPRSGGERPSGSCAINSGHRPVTPASVACPATRGLLTGKVHRCRGPAPSPMSPPSPKGMVRPERVDAGAKSWLHRGHALHGSAALAAATLCLAMPSLPLRCKLVGLASLVSNMARGT